MIITVIKFGVLSESIIISQTHSSKVIAFAQTETETERERERRRKK